MTTGIHCRSASLALVAAAALGLAACTNTPLYGDSGYPGNSYPSSGYPSNSYPSSGYPGNYPNSYPAAAPSQAYAQWGQVVNVELVRGGGQSSGTIGTIAGGVVGGLAGNQIGGGTGRTVATVAGAIGGALVGRAIEQNTRQPTEDHYRVTVRLEDGTVRAFDYREPPNVRQGDRVRVDGNDLYR